MPQYDAVIIGAGVTGCAAARALSRYAGRFLVLERAGDLCEGASKANSAIIHAGFDARPGSWKARMNVLGSRMMDRLAEELDVPFRRNGALVACLSEEGLPRLRALYDRGRENGVEGLSLLTGAEARALEPNLTGQVCGALLAETSGIVCPFELTLGLGENAAHNGVCFLFDAQVTGLCQTEGGWTLETTRGPVTARAVVNAAGVYAGELHNQVCKEKLRITPRKGEYCLLDRTAGGHVSRTIFQLPGPMGKGVLVTPTIHGNLLVGPTAADVDDPQDVATTARGLAEVKEKSAWAVKDLPLGQTITSFSGLRAHEAGDDFILGESAPGFFDGAGIESPGLSSAPAIGEYLAGLIADRLGLAVNRSFDPFRRGIPKIAALSSEERAAKIKENPLYGHIVCRCEEVSEGEILDAVHSTLGARTLDGVKRRTRAGMGRCQSGFCSPRVMEILARELGLTLDQVRKNGPGSAVVLEKTREGD